MSAQPSVLRVFRVDTHGGVAHDGFGTCGGHYGIVASVGVPVYHFSLCAGGAYGVGISVGYIIAEVVQVAFLYAVFHFFGREHRLCLGVPVDHAQAAVDEPFPVEVDEDFEHALASLLVHRKGGAVPVTRGAEVSQLLQDDAAVLVCPVPGVLQKLLAGQVALLDALFGQAVHYFGLCGYRGVVCAGHPAGVLALQSCLAHQDVLDSIVEHMSHVQHAGHVGRRDDDGVGLTSVGFGAEQVVLRPILIPFPFYFFGIVFTG